MSAAISRSSGVAVAPNCGVAARRVLGLRHLLWFLPIGLVVDSINGLMLKVGLHIPLSAWFKMFVLATFVGYLAFHSRRRFLIVVAAVGWLAAIVLFHQMDAGGVESAARDLQWGLRAILLLSAYLAVDDAAARGGLDIPTAQRVFRVSALVVLVNLALGLAGFGFAQYDDRFGVAGFFYAGNELAACILSIATVLLGSMALNAGAVPYTLTVLLLVGMAALTLTKTAIAGVMILAVAIPVAAIAPGLARSDGPAKRLVRILLATGMSAVVAGVGIIWFVVNSGFLDRVLYFFERFGWSRVIWSGRDVRMEMIFGNFELNGNLGHWVFGRGVEWLQLGMGGQSESDVVDFLAAFGFPAVIALTLLLIWSIRAAAGSYTSGSAKPLAGAVAIFGALLLAIALFAGHVFNSGVAAPFVGAALALGRCNVVRREDGSLVIFSPPSHRTEVRR